MSETPTSSTTGDTPRIAPSRGRRVPLFMLLGAISGALSAAAVSSLADALGRGILLPIYFAPGLIFGVVFGTLLVWSGWLAPAHGALWIFAATVSNAAAVQCATTVTPFFVVLSMNNLVFGLTGLFAGAVGGGLLAFITAIIVPTVRARHCLLLTAAGAMLGLLLLSSDLMFGLIGLFAGAVGGGLLALITVIIVPALRARLVVAAGAMRGPLLILFDKNLLGIYVFYAIWQGGYAAALALALPPPLSKPPQ